MIKETTKEVITEDAQGNIKSRKTVETVNMHKNQEPDYIKIYTRMWCEFNSIPDVYRNLFLELATHMSYCRSSDLASSQCVYTGKPFSDEIMARLGWKRAMYQRGLKVLTECGAIKKVARGVYQINPSYAGKGEWMYNPKANRGGVQDLVATFDFGGKSVDTKIIWADDGSDPEMLANFGAPKGKGYTVKEIEQIPGQTEITDIDMNTREVS